MENIEGFLLDHGARDERLWHRLDDGARGPFFVSARHAPRKDRFLVLVHRKREKSPGCDPLDGREHSIDEVARWLKNPALAYRFVGLGVILGVLDLASPWEPRAGGGPGESDRDAEWPGGLRFRLKGSRPRVAIAGAGSRATAQGVRRWPVPRRPRHVHRRRARACGRGHIAAS